MYINSKKTNRSFSLVLPGHSYTTLNQNIANVFNRILPMFYAFYFVKQAIVHAKNYLKNC